MDSFTIAAVQLGEQLSGGRVLSLESNRPIRVTTYDRTGGGFEDLQVGVAFGPAAAWRKRCKIPLEMGHGSTPSDCKCACSTHVNQSFRFAVGNSRPSQQ